MCPEMQPARNPGTLYAEHSHRKSTILMVSTRKDGDGTHGYVKENRRVDETLPANLQQEVNLQELIESLDMVGIPWVDIGTV